MTTATLQEMDARHPWFTTLDAEHRSWVTLLARAGIDSFVAWVADETDEPVTPGDLFSVAPREVMRQISLHQTVELVRTTVEVVEQQVQQMPRADQTALSLAVVYFSREVAFAAAEVYATAAEVRGSWDARLEVLVVDAVVRGEADQNLVSRASTLGWQSPSSVAVIVGAAPSEPREAIEALRRTSTRVGLDTLLAIQGDRLVVVAGGDGLSGNPVGLAEKLAPYFGAGPIVVGPVVDQLADAGRSARSAFSGIRAAHAWPGAPRPVAAVDLLPERVLAGDEHARRALANDIFQPLQAAGGELTATVVAFFDAGSSIEAAARALYVHPNTVRYRLRRVQDVTGYHPGDPRSAYVLRLALTVGRLLGPA
ncbi:MAG: helix-turn-helix domain-containing protein [Actinomycetia bacterium]|nr:helix-turn-helix domain-containing protein [Actinomycetes bacterium]